MPRNALLEWEGREYDHKPKTADWYWALGIIATACTVALVLFGSYLIAVLVVIAAITIGLHAAKHPPLHRFRLVEQGLFIGEDLHPFDNMISFSIFEDTEDEFPPILSIKTKSWLTPHLLIPLEGANVDFVYAHFLQNVEEVEHSHTFVDVVAAWLGF